MSPLLGVSLAPVRWLIQRFGLLQLRLPGAVPSTQLSRSPPMPSTTTWPAPSIQLAFADVYVLAPRRVPPTAARATVSVTPAASDTFSLPVDNMRYWAWNAAFGTVSTTKRVFAPPEIVSVPSCE